MEAWLPPPATPTQLGWLCFHKIPPGGHPGVFWNNFILFSPQQYEEKYVLKDESPEGKLPESSCIVTVQA